MPGEIVIPLASHELDRRERVGVLKEVLTGAMLLNAGVAGLRGEHAYSVALAVFDIVVGATVVALGVVEVKRRRKFGHAVRWFDVAAGGLLVAEGLGYEVEGHHHWQLGACYMFAGALAAGLGIFHEQLSQRRTLTLDDWGIHFRANLVRRFRVAWSDVTSVRASESAITIVTRGGGSRTIARRHAGAWERVRDAVLESARTHGVAPAERGAQY